MKLPTLAFFFALLSLVGGFAIGLLFKKQRANFLPQQLPWALECLLLQGASYHI